MDFTEKEISDAKFRNRLRAKSFERNSNNINDEDSKSNGIKINKNEVIIEENGQNIINNIEENNGNDNNINDNVINNNGRDDLNMDEISNNLKSDIYMDEKQKQKNNKKPSKNVKKNN